MLVVGGGLGGVAAAEDLVRSGVAVILTEPTSHLGRQFTASGFLDWLQTECPRDEGGAGYPEIQPALLASFQTQLAADGIPTRWKEVVAPP